MQTIQPELKTNFCILRLYLYKKGFVFCRQSQLNAFIMRRLFLYPFSMIYGLIMIIRNWLYDKNILKSKEFDIPVISVGNLSVGGTGKTPHIEYLVRLLSDRYNIATLSRGYKRKTKGFLQVSANSTAIEAGDEPLQIVNKFENIKVFVDENRKHGIKEILHRFPETDIILLDDAFQHRAVKPGLSIILTDYFQLYSNDYILPSGNLREPRCGAKRADIIVVTKTGRVYSPIVHKQLVDSLKPQVHQNIYLSYIKYGKLTPVNDQINQDRKRKTINTILLFSGIANPYPLEHHLKKQCFELITVTFPDHHQYNASDIEMINQKWNNIYTKNKILVTTEKDYMRLKNPEIWELVVNLPIHYISIEVDFHNGGKNFFDRQILDYVEKNKGNSRIHSNQNKNQT